MTFSIGNGYFTLPFPRNLFSYHNVDLLTIRACACGPETEPLDDSIVQPDDIDEARPLPDWMYYALGESRIYGVATNADHERAENYTLRLYSVDEYNRLVWGNWFTITLVRDPEVPYITFEMTLARVFETYAALHKVKFGQVLPAVLTLDPHKFNLRGFSRGSTVVDFAVNAANTLQENLDIFNTISNNLTSVQNGLNDQVLDFNFKITNPDKAVSATPSATPATQSTTVVATVVPTETAASGTVESTASATAALETSATATVAGTESVATASPTVEASQTTLAGVVQSASATAVSATVEASVTTATAEQASVTTATVAASATVESATVAASVTTDTVAAASVTTATVAAASVTTATVAASVTTATVAAASVTTDTVAAASVTTATVAAASVTTATVAA
eukprot:Opistho-2@73593